MIAIILFLGCVLAFLAGAGVLVVAKSAIHEIEAFMLFLIGAVLLTGASVVEAINIARNKLIKAMEDSNFLLNIIANHTASKPEVRNGIQPSDWTGGPTSEE
jgi:hypothetical protein